MKDTVFRSFMRLSTALGDLGLSRIPGTVGLYHLTSMILRPRGERVIESMGNRLYVNAGDTGIGSHLMGLGVYEARLTELMGKMVRPGMVVFDIGANIGYYTLIFSRLVGDSGRVYAFEPEENNFALLKKNVELNGLGNVILVKKAVSDRAGSARLYLEKNNLGMHSLSRDNNRINNGYASVDTITLDAFMAEQHVKPGFVKLDVEGAEGLVFAGAGGLLLAHGVRMVMEYYPHHLKNFGTDPVGLLKLIEGHGYRIEVVDRSKDGSGRANLLLIKD